MKGPQHQQDMNVCGNIKVIYTFSKLKPGGKDDEQLHILCLLPRVSPETAGRHWEMRRSLGE